MHATGEPPRASPVKWWTADPTNDQRLRVLGYDVLR